MPSAATAESEAKDTELTRQEGRPCAGLFIGTPWSAAYGCKSHPNLMEVKGSEAQEIRCVFSARSCDVASEDAEFARGIAHLGEGVVEAGRVFGFEVNEKLIFPGTAVNRAALDFEQVHSALRKRLEGSKQGAGAMRESHGQGSLARPGRLPRRSLFPRHQENETREIFWVVLDVFRKNQAAIMFRGAAPGYGSARFISRRNHLADAAGGVLGWNAVPFGMGGKKTLALRQRHGMGGHRTDVLQRSTWEGDELHFDRQDRFRDDGELAFEEQIEHAHHGTGQGVLHGGENGVGSFFLDGAKDGLEGGAGHGGDGPAEKLNRGGFTEGARLSLESDANGFVIGCHGHAISCNRSGKNGKRPGTPLEAGESAHDWPSSL